MFFGWQYDWNNSISANFLLLPPPPPPQQMMMGLYELEDGNANLRIADINELLAQTNR